MHHLQWGFPNIWVLQECELGEVTGTAVLQVSEGVAVPGLVLSAEMMVIVIIIR